MELVAQAETISEHHLGQTIVKEGEARNMALDSEVTAGEVIKGNGIVATVAGYKLAIGTVN
ncbi:hypothetical protein [Bacillus sp. B15-48]|uniref:hypothetical protein n=1 Tax=Bacillus sp. B15-48 TaxID=1548601 RepID=UPI00193F2E2A